MDFRSSQCVDPGTTWITEAEEFGDLVEGFACGVVNSAADELVGPCAVGGLREKEVRVTAGDDRARACASARRMRTVRPRVHEGGPRECGLRDD